MYTISTEDTSSVSLYDSDSRSNLRCLFSDRRSSLYVSQFDRWSLLSDQWSSFMAMMGHLWWGSAPLDRIDEIVAQMPNGSMVIHDPLPYERLGTFCSVRAKENDAYKNWFVRVLPRLNREITYTVAREEGCSSLVNALNDIKKGVKNGCFLPRTFFEPSPDRWLRGSFDTIMQGVKDLRRRLYDDNTFWGDVRDESCIVLREHIRKQPPVPDRTYGIVVRYADDIPDGHLFVVLHLKQYVRVFFAPCFFIVRRKKTSPKHLENADAVMEYITHDLRITLLPVDETVF